MTLACTESDGEPAVCGEVWGTSLKTSIGTAAGLHVFSTAPNPTGGCELFGPLLAFKRGHVPTTGRSASKCASEGGDRAGFRSEGPSRRAAGPGKGS